MLPLFILKLENGFACLSRNYYSPVSRSTAAIRNDPQWSDHTHTRNLHIALIVLLRLRMMMMMMHRCILNTNRCNNHRVCKINCLPNKAQRPAQTETQWCGHCSAPVKENDRNNSTDTKNAYICTSEHVIALRCAHLCVCVCCVRCEIAGAFCVAAEAPVYTGHALTRPLHTSTFSDVSM